MKRTAAVLAALSAALLASACGQPAPDAPQASAPAPTPQQTQPAAVEIDPTPIALAIAADGADTMMGNPAEGRRVFGQNCRTCHTDDGQTRPTGPTLLGVVDREAGTIEGFRYTEANRTSGIVWSDQELFDYLENPRGKIPGTNMAFVGIREAQRRADLIAYLRYIAQADAGGAEEATPTE